MRKIKNTLCKISLSVICAVTLISCQHTEDPNLWNRSCIDTRQDNIREVLLANESQRVCIRGPLRVAPHRLYFNTRGDDETSLYGGKIFLPMSYADGLRADLVDKNVYEYEGVLRISKNSNCSTDSCFVYYLDFID